MLTHARAFQALSIFEEHISDSREQFAALTLVMGTLRSLPPAGERTFLCARYTLYIYRYLTGTRCW